MFWNLDCDVVSNLVVEIEIFNFCLFVCLFTCLSVPHVMPISQEEMVQSWFKKLFWNQGCDVVSNLVVEIAIYNFDLFHTALIYMPINEAPADLAEKLQKRCNFWSGSRVLELCYEPFLMSIYGIQCDFIPKIC